MSSAPKDLNIPDLHSLDKQIENLLKCKPLSENDVKILCEKVTQIDSY